MRRLLVLVVGITGIFLIPDVASAQHGGTCEGPQPLLSVGDFDGDGVVTNADKALLNDAKKGEYVAFFDLNADGKLSGQDVALVAKNKGATSTVLDRQLAELFWATEMYRDKDNAIAAGYRPFTQQLQGHGQHYARLPFKIDPTTGGLDANYENVLDGTLEIDTPEGLNYDPDGKLVAVFYYQGIDILSWVFTPVGTPAWYSLFNASVLAGLQGAGMHGGLPPFFDSEDENWHQHWGGCWDNLDYPAMTFNTNIVPQFNQHVFPAECAARATDPSVRQGWIPAFNMLHVWLYDLNPCGTFAGIHPHVSESYPPEPEARPLAHFLAALGIPNPYGAGDGH